MISTYTKSLKKIQTEEKLLAAMNQTTTVFGTPIHLTQTLKTEKYGDKQGEKMDNPS